MKINLHTPIEEAQVQLIPLIDVIFCILTFFLLASLQLTRQQAINVDLPKASSSTATDLKPQRQILPVTIDAVGQTYVEKQPVRREQLGEILSKYLQANPTGTVVLYASRSATYNDVIELLDLLRQVGGNRVSLGIIPGSSAQPKNSPPPVTPVPFPVNPQGNPNLYQPSNPDQNPFPTVPNQPPIGTPVNPGAVPQQPTTPSTSNPTPQR
ncbi:ExbD/TolR family protein [Chlorogloeopsis fritschii PCC 9212]|uniref:Biopolymer transporter ExbD n=1 Tax=Chlorogloeopsis fritschii PCC 6912 TaxID=211165 RepID=A0A433NQ64_CHLFR|nr:biopolymer transporter ExbD [Chlorogloeopsis fritschii]RUR85968.1 biopolymer transporter ExbD [Chlorogloeopsis fritschii PCC 6912]